MLTSHKATVEMLTLSNAKFLEETMKLTKLQNHLAAKTKTIDSLVEQTQRTKVLTEKVKNVTQNISKLGDKRSLVKGCISEINTRLLQIIETRDSFFNGVFGSRAFAKQGRYEEEKLKNETDRKHNEASGSGKDKGKGISEKENDQNPLISKSKRIDMKKRDKELDEVNALRKKFEAEETEAKNVNLILET
ncbi:unnamed protein product [Lactuca saligna]|uniref:Uncharacterized protein n=1 Tax=Lactuca saligna TaxID=75948 RepID=A0AA35ZXF1_LACSI|nr:unnamed protein product [Lactuca saligna]